MKNDRKILYVYRLSIYQRTREEKTMNEEQSVIMIEVLKDIRDNLKNKDLSRIEKELTKLLKEYIEDEWVTSYNDQRTQKFNRGAYKRLVLKRKIIELLQIRKLENGNRRK